MYRSSISKVSTSVFRRSFDGASSIVFKIHVVEPDVSELHNEVFKRKLESVAEETPKR